jgi:Arc/MetJ family transcription regulator
VSEKPKGRVAEPALARKNMDMDAGKLAEARRILGARTDTETVDRALDAVIFQGQISDALDRLAGAGGVAELYPPRAKSTRR